MTPTETAVLIGAVDSLALFAAHYALDTWAPSFKAHPPRAYTVGVGLLFAGFAVWTLVCPGPFPTSTILWCWALITAVAALGTWSAWALHTWQKTVRAARVRRGLQERG